MAAEVRGGGPVTLRRAPCSCATWTRRATSRTRMRPSTCRSPSAIRSDLLTGLDHAGEILLGPTPFAAPNYLLGIPATLPTGGYAQLSSGVTARTFMKTTSVGRTSPDALARLAPGGHRSRGARGLPRARTPSGCVACPHEGRCGLAARLRGGSGHGGSSPPRRTRARPELPAIERAHAPGAGGLRGAHAQPASSPRRRYERKRERMMLEPRAIRDALLHEPSKMPAWDASVSREALRRPLADPLRPRGRT